MTMTSARRAALSCALLATTAFCGLTAQPAAAVTPTGTPAVHQSIDANGVDMASGTFNLSAPVLSIGPDGRQGLVYSRELRGAGWRDSLTATMDQDASGKVVVSIAGSSDRFTQSGSTYTNTEGNGATLSYNGGVYTYTTRDGTVAVFSPANGQYDRFAADIGWIRDITFPNGVKWTYTYLGRNYCPHELDAEIRTCGEPLARSVRLQSVTTNSGYQMKLSYSANTLTHAGQLDGWNQLIKVTALNNAVEYCDPAADTCAISGSWPSVSYTSTPNNVAGGWDETQTDASNAVTIFRLDPSYRIKAARRPGASSDDLTVSYDPNGRVSTLTRAGVTYGYSWSDNGNVRTMTMTGPLSAQIVAKSDIDTSLVRSITDALGRTTSFDYDASHRLKKKTAHEGNYEEYIYDARGNVTQSQAVAKTGSGLTAITASASFAAACSNPKTCNQPDSTTDARGNTTDYSYDPTHGGVLTVTAPAPTAGGTRPQTRVAYGAHQAYYKNSTGSIVASGGTIYLPTSTSACQTAASCTGTADEVKATVSYGPQSAGTANNLLPVSASTGAGDNSLVATSTFGFDSIGNLLTVDGPLAGTADTTRTRYDAMRRVTGTVSPDPDGTGSLKHRAARNSYNSDGQVTKTEAGTVNSQSDADWAAFTPLEAAETSYDANGRPVVQKLVAGGTVHALSQTGYDALGRPDCTAQRMNPAEYGSLPANACDLDTPGSFGPDRISKAIYDEVGRLKEARSGVGTAEEAADARYTFRPNGQVETATDGEGNVTSYAYDGHDRLKTTTYTATAQHPATSETLTYESVGGGVANSPLVANVVNRAGQTIAFSYDALGRTTFKDLPNTIIHESDISYAYDNFGRLKSTSDSKGITFGFGYDALGRMTQRTSGLGALNHAYDLAGRRTRITHGDGFFADYDRLVTGEVSAIRENGATSGVGVLASFVYDDLGRRTSLTRGNGTATSYGHDGVSRLASLTQDLPGSGSDLTLGFAYNPASQIVSNTRSNDLYSWAGATTGTVTTPANPLNQAASAGGTALSYDAKGNLTWDGTRSYGYTADNKLAAVSNGNMGYDPLGRLHILAGEQRLLSYDGDELIAEHLNNSGFGLMRRYVHGPGSDEPLVWYEGAGTSDRRFLHADERGSIVAHSDAAGKVTARVTCDE